MPDTGAVAVATGEEARARGCAGRADMVVGEVGAFGVEVVDVGCLDDVIAMAAEVTISLVVGNDKYDVWFLFGHDCSLE